MPDLHTVRAWPQKCLRDEAMNLVPFEFAVAPEANLHVSVAVQVLSDHTPGDQPLSAAERDYPTYTADATPVRDLIESGVTDRR
jgi:hypothetical protein